MKETVLFVATLSDNLARKYWHKTHGEIENDSDFYFLLPSEMREYDPQKIIWVLEPRALRHPNVRPFVEDWYLFHDIGSIEKLVSFTREYAPYVCLLRLERQNIDTLESVEDVRCKFTSVYHARSFDPRCDMVKDVVVRFSDVLLQMEEFHRQHQPYLKTQEQSLGRRTAY